MEYDLVFEGGGAKGSVFVGALKEFESRGHTARRFLGTSAGAITATLMAAGFSADEMLEAVNEKLKNGKPRFSTFMDIPESFGQSFINDSLTYAIFKKVDIPWVPEWMEGKVDKKIFDQLMRLDAYRESFSFIERGGLFSGMTFLKWIHEKLNNKIPNLGESTLKEFHQRTGSDLSLVASDTEGETLMILNHRTAPDCPVAWAVRMSMSIPFVWQEVLWQESWGLYRGRNIHKHTIVDGGVLSNFPINLLTSADEEVKEIMGDTDPDAVPNLGFLIDEELSVKDSGVLVEEEGTEELEGGLVHNVKRLKTVRRISRLINTMTKAHDNLSIREHADEICRLPAKGYGTTEFDMSNVRLQALLNAGQNAMKDYFDAHPEAGGHTKTLEA